MIHVRYFAAARAATGLAEERLADLDGVTVAELVGVVSARHSGLANIISACGFLVDGAAVREPTTVIPAGSEVDVLPPFAGG